MSLKKIIREFAEDDISKVLEGDPIKDVYFLTNRNLYTEGILIYRTHVAIEHLSGELLDEMIDKYPFLEHDPNEYYYYYMDNKIDKVDHQRMADDLKGKDMSSDLDPYFTSMALEYIEMLEYPTLFHFSDKADYIMIQGFTKGVAQADELALTTHFSDGMKELGGFNFAFYQESRIFDPTRYGDLFVMFTVPKAILCTHWGDQEEQVIFWGEHAEDIIYFEVVDGYDMASDFGYSFSIFYDDEGDFPSIIKTMNKFFSYIDSYPFIFDDLSDYIKEYRNIDIDEWRGLEKNIMTEYDVDILQDILDATEEYIQDKGSYVYGLMMIDGIEKKVLLDTYDAGTTTDELFDYYAEYADHKEIVKKIKNYES